MEAPLWEIMGRPCATHPLPPSGAPSWKAARASLHEALRNHGYFGKVRSAQTLWRILCGGCPPCGSTWGNLLKDKPLSDLLEKLKAGGVHGMRLVTWNARWMVDSSTHKTVSKRAIVARFVATNAVVAIQETHWNDADAAGWLSSFPGATVHYAVARQGPGGASKEALLSFVRIISLSSGSVLSRWGVCFVLTFAPLAGSKRSSFVFTFPRETMVARSRTCEDIWMGNNGTLMKVGALISLETSTSHMKPTRAPTGQASS